MAIVKFTKDGYGQIELNQVAWRRDGRVEAQIALDGVTDFVTDKAENGMLLAVDKTAGVYKKGTSTLAKTLPIVINYSSEHMYDDRAPGLKNFALGKDDFLPRTGYPSVGDTITTNMIAYDEDFAEDDAALKANNFKTTPGYAGLNDGAPGCWTVTAEAPLYGPIAKVVKGTSMPDGSFALKLQVIKII